MKKIFLAAALSFVPALFLAGKVQAQTKPEFGTEVCVNASGVEDAKRRFPAAHIHVLPDFSHSEMNGWRIVSGRVRANGRFHTDEEELKLRLHDRNFRSPGE